MNNYLDWEPLFIRPGRYECSDIFTVEGLETRRQQLVRAAIYTFSLFFPAFKSEIGLEVTPLVTFVSEWW